MNCPICNTPLATASQPCPICNQRTRRSIATPLFGEFPMANAYQRTEPMSEPLWEPEAEPAHEPTKAELAWLETFAPTTIRLTSDQKSLLLESSIFHLTMLIAVAWFVLRIELAETIPGFFKLVFFGWVGWYLMGYLLDLLSGVAQVAVDRLGSKSHSSRNSIYKARFERVGRLDIDWTTYRLLVKGAIYQISYSRFSKRLWTIHQAIPKQSLDAQRAPERENWSTMLYLILFVAFWYLFRSPTLNIFNPTLEAIDPTFFWALGETLAIIVLGRLLSALVGRLLHPTTK
ncbi:hypothetical protein [Herpetosiphon geysericola]|uniref:Uncharacterized protein n=1 Tax=Herpetosiphon geysericola TaxID=70996 RepID=A0A0P6XNG8_9CHLR|nr:hypothetical protein [Herpetosiphon geysericola]KPL81936.1 hypothetical protein SE18_20265 [Herpetosiphon geysericola]